MADEESAKMKEENVDKNTKTEGKKSVFVPQSVQDLQRMKIDKLMSNPDKLAYIPEPKKEWKPSDPKDFVRFVMGSSAGAGSGEFHVYRGTRRREYNRVKYIEDKAKEEEADDQYHKKLEENQLKAEEKTAKKRAKRQKKKQRKQALKKAKPDDVKNKDVEEETKDSPDNEPESEGDSDDES